MTETELRKLERHLIETKQPLAVLVMDAPKSWRSTARHPARVKTPFGLVRWYPGHHADVIWIYVEVEKITALIRRIDSDCNMQYIRDHAKGEL